MRVTPDNRSPSEILDKILGAAIAISEAACGDIQILDPESDELEIARQHGLPTLWVAHWENTARPQAACGRALERRERIIVEDVSRSLLFGAEERAVQLSAGVRAMQSTPLLDLRGKPIGVLSTYSREARRPPDRALRLLDLLATQAAQVIGRLRDRAVAAEPAREAAQAPRAAPARAAPAELEDAHHLVLYVEDNHANVVFMRDLLGTFENLEIATAPTAELARELAAQLVIMDLNLPGMSGRDALHLLRTIPETQHIPVIAVTAAAFERDRQRGDDAGFFRYLAKPVKLDDLIEAITAALAAP